MIRGFAFFIAALLALLCAPAFAEDNVANCVWNAPHTGMACELTPTVSTAIEANRMLKSSPGVLMGLDVANWSQTQNLTVMLFDAPLTATPQGGTVAACPPSPNASCLVKWFAVATANGTAPGIFTRAWYSGPPLKFNNGLYVACSSTGPTTLTLVPQCTFSAEID